MGGGESQLVLKKGAIMEKIVGLLIGIVVFGNVLCEGKKESFIRLVASNVSHKEKKEEHPQEEHDLEDEESDDDEPLEPEELLLKEDEEEEEKEEDEKESDGGKA